MQGLFVFAIVIMVLAVIAGTLSLGWRHFKGTKTRSGDMSDGAVAHAIASGLFVGFVGFAAILTLFSSFTPVGTREDGVVTSFGRLAGHVGPGVNWVAPWDNVTAIDESYQVTDETFTVRIAGGQTAQATVQVRWNPQPGAVDDIFQNYKTAAGVQSGLLDPELNAATNQVLDGYDPLTPLATGAQAGTAGNPSTTQLGNAIEANLDTRVGTDIHIATLTLKPLVYDATVQGRINSVLGQTAKTDVAKQSILTAQAQAQANRIIAASLTNNQLAIVQQCNNGLLDGDITPVAGFSCWPGSNSSVVIPAASK